MTGAAVGGAVTRALEHAHGITRGVKVRLLVRLDATAEVGEDSEVAGRAHG